MLTMLTNRDPNFGKPSDIILKCLTICFFLAPHPKKNIKSKDFCTELSWHYFLFVVFHKCFSLNSVPLQPNLCDPLTATVSKPHLSIPSSL